MSYHGAAERPEPPQQNDGEQEQQDEQGYGNKGPIRLEGNIDDRLWLVWVAEIHVDNLDNNLSVIYVSDHGVLGTSGDYAQEVQCSFLCCVAV